MIKCPECGREISNTVKQCPRCGYRLTERKQRIRVSDHKALEKRIKEIDSSVQKNRADAVEHVSELIDGAKEVSLKSKSAIADAEIAYYQLDEKQRKEVDNYAVLKEAKAKYDVLCAGETVRLIKNIGAGDCSKRLWDF